MSDASVLKKKQIVQFFIDPQCQIPFPDNILNFNEVVDVGTESKVTIWMKNISGEHLDNIELTIQDKEVSIQLSKKELAPNEVSSIIIVWRPTVARGKFPLNSSVNIKARVVIKP